MNLIHSRAYKIIKRYVGKAIHRYDMINDGDRILLGLSGGVDSFILLWILNERKKRILIDYELIAVFVDPGFDDQFGKKIETYCKANEFHLLIDHTDYGLRAHSTENRENPCFLCSRLRRKRLFEIAAKYGCKKIALGHHKDDIIETLFINMCYSGAIGTMVPAQSFFKNEFQIIRPLAFVEQETINRFAKEIGFPVLTNPCPSANNSKRSEIKKLLTQLYKTNKNIKSNIFNSMSNVNTEYLLI
ncbi:MAG: tRNA 2-thiocytidine(32) synthetase TtcA [Deltaproteobacteria bacterium]|nr:tRNA 2-thiocytidine(32) synthetase TtcA [Deltaproteobacteria bacterium]